MIYLFSVCPVAPRKPRNTKLTGPRRAKRQLLFSDPSESPEKKVKTTQEICINFETEVRVFLTFNFNGFCRMQ